MNARARLYPPSARPPHTHMRLKVHLIRMSHYGLSNWPDLCQELWKKATHRGQDCAKRDDREGEAGEGERERERDRGREASDARGGTTRSDAQRGSDTQRTPVETPELRFEEKIKKLKSRLVRNAKVLTRQCLANLSHETKRMGPTKVGK